VNGQRRLSDNTIERLQEIVFHSPGDQHSLDVAIGALKKLIAFGIAWRKICRQWRKTVNDYQKSLARQPARGDWL
jgi:hypothetical protein